MKTPLRILHLEDDPKDAELVRETLEAEGFAPEIMVVQTRADYLAQLDHDWEIILADYSLPQFDGMQALELFKERGLDLSFILISGTIGEAAAVAAMKAGASDYVMKDQLERLGPAIERGLKETDERRERKRTDKALLDSKNYLANIINTIGDPVFVKDERFQFVLANDALCTFLGKARDEIIGTTCMEFLPPDQMDHFLEVDREVLASGDENLCEEPLTASDGMIRTIVTKKTRYVDTQGAKFIVGVIRDITDRKLTELYRKVQAEMLDAAPNSITVHDLEGRFLYANLKTFEIHGFEPDEFMGLNLRDVDTEESAELIHHRMKLIDEKGEASFETCHRCKDGSTLTLEVFAQKTMWMECPAILSIATDISERKKAEEEKEKLEDQLRQSAKMEAVGRLAGGVAHDFNNILTGINGYAEMIIEGLPVDDFLRPNMEVILNAGKRAAGLTNQLLAFSRKQVIAPRVIAPNDILVDSQKMLRRIIGEDIDFVFAPGKRLWRINADPTQLDQVLMNLAVNARDAMPDGGKLTVETQNVTFYDVYCKSHAEFIPGDYVMLAVTDTGHGMDEETKSKIFEPFFSTKEVGKGTGLGLSMVYGVMKQNKGFINVYSEIDEGTTFKIYFPALKEKAEKLSKDKLADMPTGTETVLLVEDEDIVRNLAKAVLERQGYTVIDAPDGKKAHLEYTQYSGEIDLLLTDVIMPKMNGRELYKKLIDLKPGLKALFMSGYTEDAIAHHGVLDKGMHFIQKPFTIEALAKAVRKALDS